MLRTHPKFEFVNPTPIPLNLAEHEPVELVRSQFVTTTVPTSLCRLPLHPHWQFSAMNGFENSTNHKTDQRYSSITLATPAQLSEVKTLQIEVVALSPATKVKQAAAISGTPKLSQLIYDLKQLNPDASISVRVAAQDGLEAVAQIAAKSGANMICLLGSEAEPALPWYVALSRAQQTLSDHNMREQVKLCVERPWQHGADIVAAAILGADCFGFSGGAYNEGILLEVSEVLRQLGFRNLLEIMGRTELLKAFPTELRHLFAEKKGADQTAAHFITNPAHQVNSLNASLLAKARSSISTGEPICLRLPINHSDCAVGATLSGKLALARSGNDLPEGTIKVTFYGSAGSSFGAFNATGLQLTLVGDAADFVGIGLGGGQLILRSTLKAQLEASRNIIAGNSVLFGATDGWCFAAGQAGDGFAMYNQGAGAVVEGIGHFGCAMMSGGTVVNLGETGSDFGVGMRGGVAYVLDRDGMLAHHIADTVQFAPVSQKTDIDLLFLLITRHLRFTNSTLAQAILDRWATYIPLFQRVSPQAVPLNSH